MVGLGMVPAKFYSAFLDELCKFNNLKSHKISYSKPAWLTAWGGGQTEALGPQDHSLKNLSLG